MSTRTAVLESVLATLSPTLLSGRFDAVALLVTVIALLLATGSLLVAMRLRATKELSFPGLEDVHAWERIGAAPVYVTTEDGIEQIRVLASQHDPRTDGPPAAHDPVPDAEHDPVPDADTDDGLPGTQDLRRTPRERIVIDDLATVHDFSVLREDLNAHVRRTRRRVTAGGLTVAGAVLLIAAL